MPRMKILSSSEREIFEMPPVFNSVDRKRFFSFPLTIERIADSLRTPTNAVCFLVMFGYFGATKRFFSKKFHQKDIEFVAKRYGIPVNQIKIDSYRKDTCIRHQEIIRDYFGFKEFDQEAKAIVIREIDTMIRSQLKPKLIMLRLIEILSSKKIEIPTYNMLASLIIDESKKYKADLSNTIEELLIPEIKIMLDSLLEKESKEGLNEEQLNIQRYKLTLLKRFHQSTKPSKVKTNIEDLKILKELFYSLEDIFKSLNLTHEGIRYYANSVIKSEIFQMTRRADEDRYLHLIAFVVHQFFRLQDLLIDAFLTAVQNNIHSVDREHKELYYEGRKEKNESFKKLFDYLNTNLFTLSVIKDIAHAPDLPDTEKIKRIQSVLSEHEQQRSEIKERITFFKKESEKALKEADFYSIVEAKSIKLQNRVSEIVKHIDFDAASSSPGLMEAIEYYKRKEGNIDKNAPVDFLGSGEGDLVFDDEGKFRISLYKSLLFRKIADAIKGGTLNLKYSYKYRSLDEYLISKTSWRQKKEEYLQRAALTKFANLKVVLQNLKEFLDKQYHKTNQNILNGKNEFIKFNKDGTFRLSTPKVETEDTEPLSEFFPKKHYIPLLEILYTVNKACNFTDAFEHWQTKYNRPKPPDKMFLAGIVGYGCNIGPSKIAKISKQINEHELENTVNWYFSEDNVSNANDKILRFMDALDLPNIYRRDRDLLHTSSDGQKLNMAVDSLNAGYSFKYHSMEKGASAYRFIDERDFLFHSTVFSSAEKEAPNVIDGLMHNDVVKSDIHSTDTDGYSEVIFGVTYLLGFTFAPRIKGLKRQSLYAFKTRKIYEQEGYKIMPDKYINEQLIEEDWDDILRFIATIKLRVTTASQLFKRLNSYSKQHILYRSVKEFGRIIKTIFILIDIDDVKLRQATEKQLNKIENAHKFSGAVSFGNNQEFLQETKEEQEIAEGCRRLIENAIICWNYLYLSQKIAEEKDEQQRQELIRAIKNGSIMTWRHVNLNGEYDFSDERLHDSVGLKVPKILELKLT